MNLEDVDTLDRYSDLEEFSDSDDPLTTTFNKAAHHLEKLIQANTKVDNKLLLHLYGLYKVSVVGKCNTPRPSWYEMKAKEKWDSWSQLSHLTSSEAKQEYIETIKQLDPTWRCPDVIEDNSEQTGTGQGWVNVSSMARIDPDIEDCEKTVFDFVRDGNVDRTKEILGEDPRLVDNLDENGLGLIHWACDRGNEAMLTNLITEYNADVNLRASDGQTPLHYAASCGYVNCVKILLDHGADSAAVDELGDTPVQVASDSSICNLIKNFKVS